MTLPGAATTLPGAAATLDETHDPQRLSWVASANGHLDFPIQNLPLGVFSPPGGARRGGVAIGDMILDLDAAAPLLAGEAREAAETASRPSLNELLALGGPKRRALRRALSALLAEGADRRAEPCLHEASRCALHLPARIGDYTDFFAGIHHARATGAMFRPENPLLPNYKWVPVGYHGRASSVVPSGTPIHRPSGQRKRAEEPEPSFGRCRNLDCELELAIWVGGEENALGEPVPVGEASGRIAGYGLLNDWSARDIQGWEYQPLGPFLAKSFCTTVSPWIITPEALEPFRIAQPPRPEGDPQPLPHLWDAADQARGALSLELAVLLRTPRMREAGEAPHRLSASHAADLYWTPAQLLAHHASNGCNLRPGDLLGTGTVSGPDEVGSGSLLELSRGGRQPVRLPNGEERRFLEDGDEVWLAARAVAAGAVSIGFGPCRGIVEPGVVHSAE